MGSLSGSAVANTATTGTFTIPMMRSAGFQPVTAAGVQGGGQLGRRAHAAGHGGGRLHDARDRRAAGDLPGDHPRGAHPGDPVLPVAAPHRALPRAADVHRHGGRRDRAERPATAARAPRPRARPASCSPRRSAASSCSSSSATRRSAPSRSRSWRSWSPAASAPPRGSTCAEDAERPGHRGARRRATGRGGGVRRHHHRHRHADRHRHAPAGHDHPARRAEPVPGARADHDLVDHPGDGAAVGRLLPADGHADRTPCSATSG